MKALDFKEMTFKLLEGCVKLLEEKQSDYSVADDVFKGFRDGAKMRKILDLKMDNPEHAAIYELIKRVQRLINLGHRKDKQEKVADLVRDSINHLILFYGMWLEFEDEEEIK